MPKRAGSSRDSSYRPNKRPAIKDTESILSKPKHNAFEKLPDEILCEIALVASAPTPEQKDQWNNGLSWSAYHLAWSEETKDVILTIPRLSIVCKRFRRVFQPLFWRNTTFTLEQPLFNTQHFDASFYDAHPVFPGTPKPVAPYINVADFTQIQHLQMQTCHLELLNSSKYPYEVPTPQMEVERGDARYDLACRRWHSLKTLTIYCNENDNICEPFEEYEGWDHHHPRILALPRLSAVKEQWRKWLAVFKTLRRVTITINSLAGPAARHKKAREHANKAYRAERREGIALADCIVQVYLGPSFNPRKTSMGKVRSPFRIHHKKREAFLDKYDEAVMDVIHEMIISDEERSGPRFPESRQWWENMEKDYPATYTVQSLKNTAEQWHSRNLRFKLVPCRVEAENVGGGTQGDTANTND